VAVPPRQDIASFLAKGKAGNWRSLFTARDKAVFKDVAGRRWCVEIRSLYRLVAMKGFEPLL